MTRTPFGWWLPPGVTDADIDRAANGPEDPEAYGDDLPEEEEEPDYPPPCTNPGGHEWVYTGTQYGGDDESYFGEGRCYCQWCGADGDA